MVAAACRAAALALSCAACTSIALHAGSFEDTRWRVVAVNGEPTPPDGDYRIAFRGGSISGRFGCNGWTGRYRFEGEMLVVGEVAATLIGCPEPSTSFEAAGFAIVNRPMRISWSSDRRLTLSNAAGSIGLQRTP